ncbi:hypothetical protein BB560_001663 [Smittium megazygosporum]|uniref:ATP synthase subunit 5, mitochondrial n=1 Tax=Smittium megazygosporum TaxID=133381 RepID=A0A2T9ZGZ4_9FUNG|nr:hypothetical protein BB560_001663 [Smittium megazygosporum]
MYSLARSLVKPSQVPLVLHGIQGKYATALYEASSSKDALEAVESDLKNLASKMSSNTIISDFLISPISDRKLKLEYLYSTKTSAVTADFYKLLMENNRINLLPSLIQSYSELMQAHRGILVVKVSSATKLDNKVLSQVKEIVSGQTLVKEFKELKIVNTINKNLIGGMIVEFGDFTVDMSVSSRIAKLDKLMTDVINA